MVFNPFSRNENEGDERIAKRSSVDSEVRVDRAIEDRPVTQNREVTDIIRGEERRAMLRATDTLLPAPPEVAGYHSFWATTTNTKDTVEQRQRLGYTFVTRAEAPGFEMSTLKSGDAPNDRIMIQEMVAMKLPLDLWKEDMIYNHHTRPKEQADALRNKVTFGQDGRGNKIAYTGNGFSSGYTDGYSDLAKVNAPNLKGVA